MATQRRAPSRANTAKPASRRKPAKTPPAAATLIEYLNESVREAVTGLGGVGRRKMLVSFGWTVGERTFALVSRQGRIVVRLPDETAQRELLALEGAERWTFGNKAPRDWLLLPETFHDDADALHTWLQRAWAANRDAPGKPRRKRTRSPKAASGR